MSKSLLHELRDKKYRDAYVASQISIGLPFQIRALRNTRGWSQEKLAQCTEMQQPSVSDIEHAGKRRLNVETLLRIAAAFDVGLQIRFVPFSQLMECESAFSPDGFSVQSFEEEFPNDHIAQ